MKILITTPNLEKPGGVANYYATLKGRFNCEVEYLTVGTRVIGEKSRYKLARLLKDYHRIYRKLRSEPFDLVHLSPSIRPKAFLRDILILVIAKLLRKKIVVHFHGWRWDWWQIYIRYFRFLITFAYLRADAFIVQSTASKNALQRLGCKKPIHVELTVVSDEVLYMAQQSRQERVGATSVRYFNILFLARVEKAKGIYESMEAFQILKERYPSITMTIAGSGSELENVKAYATSRELNYVEFLGWVSGEAKHRAFANADVYLLPSWSEGMPISLLEAMAYGLPVVARPVGGIADLFEQGEIGFKTEDGDPEVIASLLEKLIVDTPLRRAIAEHNCSFARENFSVSRAIQRLEEIYRAVVPEDLSSATGLDNKEGVETV